MFGRMLMVLFAYFATGKLGLLIPSVGVHITLIWLPTGIAVAALLRWGNVNLVAIFLAAFLVNLSVGSSSALAAQVALGNTLGPLLTVALLRHFEFQPALSRSRDIMLMIFAAMIGMVISATGGVLALAMNNYLGDEQFIKAWLIWWLGDVVGVLLLLPLLLNINKQELNQFWQYRVKVMAWFALIVVLEWVLFRYLQQPAGHFMLVSFVLLPFVIWAAMRFGITGASIVVMTLSLLAVVAMTQGRGPFYSVDIQQSVFALWIFMVTLVVIALMITAMMSRQLSIDKALRESESKLRGMINGALDAIVTIDHKGHIVEFNPAAEHIFGHTRAEVLGLSLADVIIPPGMREAHSTGHANFIRSGEKRIFDQRLELSAIRADGTEFPIELTITSLHDQGQPLVTGFIRDLTEKKRAEQEIQSLAFFDALTGLPNRRLLMDRLRQAFASTARAQKYGAVIFIDLDNFKTLNDSRGHDYGDLLLIEVSRRLRGCVRDEDTVSRLSGDEFVIILEELKSDIEQSVSEARLVGEKILDTIHQPYQLKDIEYHNSCSIGISLFLGYGTEVDELLKRSDTAMYQAKAAGRNALKFYDPQMQEALERRIGLEAQMRVALQRQQFVLLYQPQVNASRKIFGAEILLRWDHPQLGLMSPTQFITIAEESGLILAIGHWVLLHACRQLKAWESDERTKGIQLAVNVSARQFRQAGFAEEVKAALMETGARPGLLKLELTESVVLDNVEDAIRKMKELRIIGVRFSMDDFGTGYSSLAYLKQLPLTQVKVDQSFVRDIATDPNDAAIVQTIIAMSSTLGLNVIAEGVETEAQFQMLQQYKCKQFQGYLFGKPMLEREFEKILVTDGLLFNDDYSENTDLP